MILSGYNLDVSFGSRQGVLRVWFVSGFWHLVFSVLHGIGCAGVLV